MKNPKRNLSRRKPPPGATPTNCSTLIKLDAAIKDVAPTPAQLKTLHACIKKVTEDLDGLRFNTAISAHDGVCKQGDDLGDQAGFRPARILDFAPAFRAASCRRTCGKNSIRHSSSRHSSLSYAAWPKFDAALLVESEMEIPVQVNGKLRDVIKVPANADNAAIEAAAKASEKVQQFLDGKAIRKVIFVPRKLINIVAS